MLIPIIKIEGKQKTRKFLTVHSLEHWSLFFIAVLVIISCLVSSILSACLSFNISFIFLNKNTFFYLIHSATKAFHSRIYWYPDWCCISVQGWDGFHGCFFHFWMRNSTSLWSYSQRFKRWPLSFSGLSWGRPQRGRSVSRSQNAGRNFGSSFGFGTRVTPTEGCWCCCCRGSWSSCCSCSWGFFGRRLPMIRQVILRITVLGMDYGPSWW